MTGESTRRGRIVAWLAARSVRQMVLAAGAVVLLISGAFGGLRQAEPDEATPLRLDTPHLAEPIRMTIKSVRWSDDLGEVIGPSEVGRYLVVFANVTTDQNSSVPGFVVRDSLRLQGLEAFAEQPLSTDTVRSEDAEPRVIVTADQVGLGEIGPGLTYEVAFIWEQRLSEPLPTAVSLVARSHSYRQSNVDTQVSWFDVTDDAVGRFPITAFEPS